MYNEAFEATINFMKDKSNAVYLETGIEFKDAVDSAKAYIQERGLTVIDNNQNDLSVLGNHNMYNSNIADKNMIGAAASFNTGHKVLSSFEVEGHDIGITINGKKIGRSYKDGGNAWLNLAYVLNINLDNSNKGSASELNMNPHTFAIYSTLLARNVDFNTVAAILSHPVVKEMANRMRNDENLTHQTALEQMGLGH